MISIPLPFVIALLMAMLAAVLLVRQDRHVTPAFIFIALCALTTTVVGLKLSFNLPLFRILQPILASCIPAAAWICFSSAYKQTALSTAHWIPPIVIIFFLATNQLWQLSVDPLLTLLYVGYGVALIRSSSQTVNIPERIRFSDMDKAQRAERLAGLVLLASALIDAAIAINFSFFAGYYALTILSIAHITLLPIIAVAVVLLSLSVPVEDKEDHTDTESQIDEQKNPLHQLSDTDVKDVLQKVESLLIEKELFLDPDLTLNRLARKAGIPARQISVAVNKTRGQSISQVVNEYRIKRASSLLVTTDKSITQVYLESGFQTKSNFNREFLRVTGNTPSQYRLEAKS